jgi:MoaA/NifB/PqqE/SkfB family radical SAM enzyme
MIITDRCNLRCKHCTVSDPASPERTFAELARDTTALYRTGARVLVVTGGEPFVWKDGGYSLEDVVAYARRLGFFRIVVCTNGTFKLESSADYLWVSLDGDDSAHNAIRGDCHSRVIENIGASSHPGIYVNFTVSRMNLNAFDKAIEDILSIRNIRGMLVHLFTPYIGSDPCLRLDKRERASAIDTIIRLKRRHPLRITNTFDGLRALKDNRWPRPLWSSVVINRGQVGMCCCRQGIYDRQVCENCGCSPATETYVLEQAKPLAIIENLRFL